MAQVTIYLPDAVARDVRRAARKAHKSVSAYLAELAARSLRPVRWPESFRRVLGSWAEFPRVADPAPEPVEPL